MVKFFVITFTTVIVFEDYLFSNAYLERSSTSRHEYASIIKENDGTLSFKLNFQVRLK
mgnify:CR=1 FL=1